MRIKALLRESFSQHLCRLWRNFYDFRAAVNVVDFDEKYIVSASGDRTIKVWSTSSCEFVRTLNGHKRGIACLQYHDRLVVSGSSDNTIRLWDIECGACLRVLEGHEELVRCIRFDSKRIVSGAYDGKIKVTWQEIVKAWTYLQHLRCGIYKQLWIPELLQELSVSAHWSNIQEESLGKVSVCFVGQYCNCFLPGYNLTNFKSCPAPMTIRFSSGIFLIAPPRTGKYS